MTTDVRSVPPVVAVVVTHDPGEWFDEALAGLAAQRYPSLSVLVVDTASAEDPSARIGRILPQAFVRRLPSNDGYGVASNTVLGMVEGASFYLLCHDDVALDPDAVQVLVEEAVRFNAGIVGPKLVDWHDPTRLLQVGLNVDKLGAASPIAERGELDQGQHDGVRDVFAVPGGCVLIRADLFEHLRGFDAAIDFVGEDLDLCWRSHVAGGRVLVASRARARHAEALAERPPAGDLGRRRSRHRLRAVLGNYTAWQLLRIVPLALLMTAIEGLCALVTGRLAQARGLVDAWTWNARRMVGLHRKRTALRRVRTVGDRELRRSQVRGAARLTELFRGTERRDAKSRRRTATATLVVLAVLAFSVRNLVTGPVPAVGEFARFPSTPGPLLREWAGGWRTAGLGSSAPAPTAFGLLGVLGVVLFGAMGALRQLLFLGMLPLGAYGAWRLARPIGSRRASVAALVVYIAIPVPYNALARGSWSGLVLYAGAPWMIQSLALASRLAPFGPRSSTEESQAASSGRPLGRQMLGLGLIVALVGAVVPFAVVVMLACAAALIVGSLVCFRVGGVTRLLVAAIGAAAVAVLLHLPWSIDLISHRDWMAFAGARATIGGSLSLGRLLRFETGPFGATPLGWGFVVAAGLPLLIGRSWRFEWAVRAWMVALAGWGVLLAAREGWLRVELPNPEIMLAPVAASLALATALGMAAFEVDLPSYRFGWRQAVAVVAAVGVVAGSIVMVTGVANGRWQVAGRDFNESLDQVFVGQDKAPFRVLWLGDPQALPLAGWPLDRELSYATTDHGVPDVSNLWAGSADRTTGLLAHAVRVAEQGGTARLGRLLAPMGVRYVVVPSQQAPPLDGHSVTPPPRRLVASLAAQLDLEQVPVSDGIAIYRNTSWVSSRSVLPDNGRPRRSVADGVSQDLSAGRPALTGDSGPSFAKGDVPAAGTLLLSSAWSPRWELRVDGRTVRHERLFGWANGFRVTPSSRGSLSYRTPAAHDLALIGQVLLWLVTVIALARYRWRRPRPKVKADS